MDIKALYQLYLAHPNISTDTRKVTSGCIFFALKGDRFDGNAYAREALDKGAAYAVVSDPNLRGEKFLYTPDTLTTLQHLANYHRNTLNIPVLAITGSNGKTTTKELITAVLSTTYKVHATAGNYNNHIGVPLTLLAVTSDTEIIICEMGANHSEEIKFLCEIAEPTHGMITNIGKAHLEGFGSIEGVMKAKGELFDYLKSNKGFVFVNLDDQRVSALGEQLANKTTYGLEQANKPDVHLSYQAGEKEDGFSLEDKQNNITIHSNLLGRYNASNMLAAYTIGLHFEVNPEVLRRTLSHFESKSNRSENVHYKGCHFIMDAYNANPSSMELSLQAFAEKYPSGWVVLGDMKELGDDTHAAHKQIVSLAESLSFKKIFLIGAAFEKALLDLTVDHQRVQSNEHIDALVNSWDWTSCQGKTIFMKGSRSMQLELLVNRKG